MKTAAVALILCSAFCSSGCLMAARTAYRSVHPPPPHPLLAALDTNHDGIIDATEMANAPVSLKQLDRNNDGRITPDEMKPQR